MTVNLPTPDLTKLIENRDALNVFLIMFFLMLGSIGAMMKSGLTRSCFTKSLLRNNQVNGS